MQQTSAKIWLIYVTILGLLISCSQKRIVSIEGMCLPGRKVPESAMPILRDDMDLDGFQKGLAESLNRLEKGIGTESVTLCGEVFSAEQLYDSLKLLQQIVRTNNEDLASLEKSIRKQFQLCEAHNGDDILVTAYYQPVLTASLEKKAPFLFPLYSIPDDLVTQEHFENGVGSKHVGRMSNGKFEPYWSRKEIEKQQVLAGKEIAYLRDPVDVFFLHIQGSGLLQFGDGSMRAILYGGSNGRAYKSIGKLLVQEGKISRDIISMPTIRQYLHEHLDEQERILHYNERYIFFRWGDSPENIEVVGSMGGLLTPGRSVAMDQRCFPYSIPAFLQSRMPVFDDGGHIGWKPFSRFVLNQDSGAAIKGSGRLDMFLGRGEEAENAAGLMQEAGRLFLLLPRKQSKRTATVTE